MTEHEDQYVEALLARYRPAEAPVDLLYRVEQAALRHQRGWHESLTAALSVAAEILLGLIVQGSVASIALIVLLLVAAEGY